MTDWQIGHLLCDPAEEKGELMSYEELFWYSYRLRNYADAEINTIWEWYNQGISNEEIESRLKDPNKWLPT